MTPDITPKRGAQAIPVYHINAGAVEDAYCAFAALRRLAAAEPHLTENPFFKALQDTAYSRFLLNFKAMK